MRIAQLAPPFLPVPPERYGGTERVIHDLTEGLVCRGHDVTLFASGDSRTSARLVPTVARSLWHEKPPIDPTATQFRVHAEVFRHASEFEVIHAHTDYFSFPYAAHSPAPVIATLHGRLDAPELRTVLGLFPDVGLVSISHAQQAYAPEARWIGNAYHGIAVEDYPFDPVGGEDLLFLSRMTRDKAPHVAIDVARAAGRRLLLAGRIDPNDRPFFEQEVQPRLHASHATYLGEVSHEQKLQLLARAHALLFPIDWPEPFGLVMVEAMACGTPVIARPHGAACEVVADKVTGLFADTEHELVAAVGAAHTIERSACRQRVEQTFSLSAMVSRYEAIYRSLMR
jgi:glycosyltransferase involved in cell wall biosynthesis